MNNFKINSEYGACEIHKGIAESSQDVKLDNNNNEIDMSNIPDENIDTNQQNKYTPIQLNKGTYYGELKFIDSKNKNLPHGFGTYIFKDGSETYQGNFKEGAPNGKGKKIWETGAVFEGEFNKRERTGTFVDSNNNIYKGKWVKDKKKDKKEGKFMIRYRNGYTCKADYSNDKIISSELKLKNDTTFRYEPIDSTALKNTPINNQPAQYYSSDEKFLYSGDITSINVNGSIINNNPHSNNAKTVNLISNEIYEGPFENGLPHTCVIDKQTAKLQLDGLTYTGEFEHGHVSGFGKLKTRNFTAEGYFKDDKIHGDMDTITWTDGSIFKGQTLRGICVQGELILPDDTVISIDPETKNSKERLILNPSSRCRITRKKVTLTDKETIALFLKLIKWITPTEYFKFKVHQNSHLNKELEYILKYSCDCIICIQDSFNINDAMDKKYCDSGMVGDQLTKNKINYINKVGAYMANVSNIAKSISVVNKSQESQFSMQNLLTHIKQSRSNDLNIGNAESGQSTENAVLQVLNDLLNKGSR